VVEQVLIAVGVMGGVMVIMTGVVAAMVVRRVRRRYRAFWARVGVVPLSTTRPNDAFRAATSFAVARLGSPGWWAVQNRRHRLWRAVSSAEHAVRVARRSDVAVGELPMLARQLRSAAERVDTLLRADVLFGSIRQENRADCERLEALAADIHGAAVSSLRDASHADAEPLVSAVRIEVAALAAGVRAARG
jgi:hypothetical protein